MSEHPFTDHIPFLRQFLAAKFGRLPEADREDIVQAVCMGVWKLLSVTPDFVPDSPWTTYLARAAINAALGQLKRAERGWFQSLADESAVPEIASAMPSPSAIADESDRRGRQTLLLSDILREYVCRCEEKKMQTQKEIYERRLRGQEPAQIATQMGVSEDNVYQHLKRARDWVLDRIQQADVARSVFQTFLRPRRETPVTSGLPDHVPHNFSEVLHRVVHEAGALCPSDERLTLYLASPDETELRDVRYHVEEAGCPLCAARRIAL